MKKKVAVNTLSCTNRHQLWIFYLSAFFDFSIFTFFFSCGICFACFIFSLTDCFFSFISCAFSFRYCSANYRYSANGPVLSSVIGLMSTAIPAIANPSHAVCWKIHLPWWSLYSPPPHLDLNLFSQFSYTCCQIKSHFSPVHQGHFL